MNDINKTLTSLFTVQEVRSFTTFFSNNMIKNFVAYQYICHENYKENIIIKNICISNPLIPLPLNQATEQ